MSKLCHITFAIALSVWNISVLRAQSDLKEYDLLPLGSIISKDTLGNINGWCFINNSEFDNAESWLLNFHEGIVLKAVHFKSDIETIPEFLNDSVATNLIHQNKVYIYEFINGNLNGKIGFDRNTGLYSRTGHFNLDFNSGIPDGNLEQVFGNQKKELVTFNNGVPNASKFVLHHGSSYDEFYFNQRNDSWNSTLNWSDLTIYVNSKNLIFNCLVLGFAESIKNVKHFVEDLNAPDINNSIKYELQSTHYYKEITSSDQNSPSTFQKISSDMDGNKSILTFLNGRVVKNEQYDSKERPLMLALYDQTGQNSFFEKREYGTFLHYGPRNEVKISSGNGTFICNENLDTLYSKTEQFLIVGSGDSIKLAQFYYYLEDSTIYSMLEPKGGYSSFKFSSDTSYFPNSEIIKQVIPVAKDLGTQKTYKFGKYWENYGDGSIKVSGQYYFDNKVSCWQYFPLNGQDKLEYFDRNGKVDSLTFIKKPELYYGTTASEFQDVNLRISSPDNRYNLLFNSENKATLIDLKNSQIVINSFDLDSSLFEFLNDPKELEKLTLSMDGQSIIYLPGASFSKLFNGYFEFVKYNLLSNSFENLNIQSSSQLLEEEDSYLEYIGIEFIEDFCYLFVRNSNTNRYFLSKIDLVSGLNREISLPEFQNLMPFGSDFLITTIDSIFVIEVENLEVQSKVKNWFSNLNFQSNRLFFNHIQDDNLVLVYDVNGEAVSTFSLPKLKVINYKNKKEKFQPNLQDVQFFEGFYYFFFTDFIYRTNDNFEVGSIVRYPHTCTKKKHITYENLISTPEPYISGGVIMYNEKLFTSFRIWEEVIIGTFNLNTNEILQSFEGSKEVTDIAIAANKTKKPSIVFQYVNGLGLDKREGSEVSTVNIEPDNLNVSFLQVSNLENVEEGLINEVDSFNINLINEFSGAYDYDEVHKLNQEKYISKSQNRIIFYNSTKKIYKDRFVSFILNNENRHLFISSDNYYSVSSDAKDDFHFNYIAKAYPLEQFDLKYNRPDIILDRLGYADSSLVDAYHSAYQKRLKKMGFTEDMLEDDFHLPEIKIENYEEMPTINDNGSIQLNLKLEDSKYKLDRINVWVNDVAIYGTNGISLRDKNVQNYSTNLTVDLAKGNNKIQVSVLNQAGAESYKETFEIECTAGKNEPNLYLITIGESEFKQSDFNLTYAAKDAKDITELLANSKAYNEVFNKTLTNEEVTKENILALKSFLQKAEINDQVMIFIAGHGVLDANLDYFFATYDMDFQHPEERGLAYEDLESLLDGIKPLKKTLMIDACHSGEIDKDEVELAQADVQEGDDIQFRAVGNTASPKLGMQNTSELTKSLFTDLRKGTGATVISSAGGMEFAIEGDDWNNGLFTYCLINGVKSKAADLNKDGEIWLSEIQEYVGQQVTELSGGRQQPTSRIENQSVDFRVW